MKNFHKMKPIILLFVIAAVSCIPFSWAMNIDIARSSYLPGETFQANITGEFVQPLTVNNIFFMMQGKEIGLAFYLLKISNAEYWVYVDLPQQTGNYTFAVKNVLYKENGTLTGTEKEKSFEIIQTTSSLYKDISDKTTGKLQSLSAADNSLLLISLKYDNNLVLQARDALLNKKISGECWNPSSPSSPPCTVKDTALALFALKKISYDADASWLIDAENNLDVGLWNLVINSQSEKQCDLYVNSEKDAVNLTSGENVINLDLKSKPDDVNVIVNCSAMNAKIVHTYLGKINEFAMQKQGDSFIKTLNNKKCFGEFYRSDCNTESTAYALLALDALGADKSDVFEWLKKNAQTTKEKSIALYFGYSDMKDWLVNNQHIDGYWAKKSLVESAQQDIEATVFAVWALRKAKENDAAGKGEEWLKNNVYGNLSNEILSTAFVFLNDKIESILSVNPAAIKTKIGSNISILAKNKGIVDLSVSADFLPFNTKKDFSLKSGHEERIEFAVTAKLGNKDIKENISGSIEIVYNKFLAARYSIPVIIIADKNITADFVVEVPKEHFRFLQQEINVTLMVNDKTLIPVTVKNLAQNAVKDISISYSRDIGYIVNITPLHIKEIDAGDEATINLVFQSQEIDSYEGFIEASADGVSAILPLNITFTKNESQVNINETIITEKNKTCNDYNGSICEKEEQCKGTVITIFNERCCMGKCERKRDLRLLGVLMILLAVFIIVIFLVIKLKKPKKEMKNVVEEIEKKYNKFAPRGPQRAG